MFAELSAVIVVFLFHFHPQVGNRSWPDFAYNWIKNCARDDKEVLVSYNTQGFQMHYCLREGGYVGICHHAVGREGAPAAVAALAPPSAGTTLHFRAENG